jgi:hypothetical protein
MIMHYLLHAFVGHTGRPGAHLPSFSTPIGPLPNATVTPRCQSLTERGVRAETSEPVEGPATES